MIDGLVETAAQAETPTDRRIYGVVLAQVIDNVDTAGFVQIHLPFLPELDPWARVATFMAGMTNTGKRYGAYFIPQKGDEVLVAFNHGDVSEPYILGCLWNGVDRPPTLGPTDAVNKRIIRTPEGHEIAFDSLAESITITSNTQQKITLDRRKIVLETADPNPEIPDPPVTVTLDRQGNLSIHATKSITLDAPTITIGGAEVGEVKIKSNNVTSIDGGGKCEIKGVRVYINEPAT